MLSYLPPAIGGIGKDIDSIIYLIFYIVLPWFIAAEAVLFYFLLRYRRKPGQKAAYAPGNDAKTLAWVLIPAVFVLGFDLMIDFTGTGIWNRIKREIPENAHPVRIIAEQFAWTFVDSGPDHTLDTADDITVPTELHVPAGIPVRFEMQSKDVIHSFFVPPLRLKQDVVPGRKIPGWFQIDTVGKYEIACTELCGIGHTKMRAFITSMAPQDFDAWQQTSAAKSGETFWE